VECVAEAVAHQAFKRGRQRRRRRRRWMVAEAREAWREDKLNVGAREWWQTRGVGGSLAAFGIKDRGSRNKDNQNQVPSRMLL
jgi:hypothetical protein